MSKRQKRNPSPFKALRQYGGWLETCAENQVTRFMLSAGGRDALHLAERLHELRKGNFSDFVQLARKNRQSYKYLCSDVWPEELLVHVDVESAFYLVCSQKYTKSAEWLIEHWRLDERLTVCRTGFVIACKTGQLTLAQQLHELHPTVMRQADQIFTTVCAHGHLNIVQWLRPRVSPEIQIRGFEFACYRNRKRLAEHLRQVTPITQNEWVDAFEMTCKYGHLDMVKWIYEWQPLYIRSHIKCGMIMAVKSNCVDLLTWLNTVRPKIKNLDIFKMYNAACALGHTPIVEFFLKHFFDVLPSEGERGFELACMYGHLDLAKQLLREEDYVTDKEVVSIFKATCARGQLNVAKWLFHTFECRVYNKQALEFAFKHACEGGHLKTAQWLTRTWPDINMMLQKNAAVTAATNNGHLHVLKWLENEEVYLPVKQTLNLRRNVSQPIEFWMDSRLK